MANRQFHMCNSLCFGQKIVYKESPNHRLLTLCFFFFFFGWQHKDESNCILQMHRQTIENVHSSLPCFCCSASALSIVQNSIISNVSVVMPFIFYTLSLYLYRQSQKRLLFLHRLKKWENEFYKTVLANQIYRETERSNYFVIKRQIAFDGQSKQRDEIKSQRDRNPMKKNEKRKQIGRDATKCVP